MLFWRFYGGAKYIENPDPLTNRKLAKKGSMTGFARELRSYNPLPPQTPPTPRSLVLSHSEFLEPARAHPRATWFWVLSFGFWVSGFGFKFNLMLRGALN